VLLGEASYWACACELCHISILVDIGVQNLASEESKCIQHRAQIHFNMCFGGGGGGGP
jgi:hypothetical protein